MQEIEASIALLPSHAEYHAALGFFLLESKDLARRKKHSSARLPCTPMRCSPIMGWARLRIGTRIGSGRPPCFTNALAAQPERAETHYYLSMVKHRLGDNQAALDWMKSAEALFAKAEDRRENHCQAWIREFERLV